MIGDLHPTARTATIIGAGFSGLLIAYRLLQKGYQVTIHEKSDRCGGLIQTLQTPFGMAETAAHSIRSAPAILQLCNELNVEIVKAQTKRKFILRDGQMKTMPLHVPEIIHTAYRATTQKGTKNQTLAEFAQHHLGDAVLNNLIAPLAHGIYAAEPEELDQQLAFPNMTVPHNKTLLQKFLFRKKPEHKSFMFTPNGGMQDLIEALVNNVSNHPNCKIYLNSEVSKLPDADNIIITTEAAQSGKLIDHLNLKSLRYAPMITATVFLPKIELEAIGVLYARGEHKDILGILFNSATFENRAANLTSLTIMLGGTKNPNILNKGDDQILNIIQQEIRRVLKTNEKIIHSVVTRWPNAIPVYSPELKSILNGLRQGWCATPGHVLAGNYTGEVSLRGMTETIYAKTA